MRNSIQTCSRHLADRALSGVFGGVETFDVLSLVDHATGQHLCPPDLLRDRDQTLRAMRGRVANDIYDPADRQAIQALIAVV